MATNNKKHASNQSKTAQTNNSTAKPKTIFYWGAAFLLFLCLGPYVAPLLYAYLTGIPIMSLWLLSWFVFLIGIMGSKADRGTRGISLMVTAALTVIIGKTFLQPYIAGAGENIAFSVIADVITFFGAGVGANFVAAEIIRLEDRNKK